MTLVYKGLILTTIKLDKEETLQDGTIILSFTNASENAGLGEATFLRDIKKKDEKFIATYVSKKEAAEFANNDINKDRIKLFCAHGCCGSPGGILEDAQIAKAVFDDKGEKNKCLPIPILWPTRGGVIADYDEDFVNLAPEAGRILANLVNDIANGSFGKVSLLCYSMGNHLVFNNAGKQNSKPSSTLVAPDVKFENIFMVAADVPNDIFSPKPRQTRDKNDFGEKEQKAVNLTEMLVEGGKIYVLHRDDDRALQLAVFLKLFRLFRPRLGTTGAKGIRKRFDGTVINFDTKPSVFRKVWDAFKDVVCTGGRGIDPTNHFYQYESEFVDFYNFVHGKKEDQTQEQFDNQVREKYKVKYPRVDRGSRWFGFFSRGKRMRSVDPSS